MRKLYLTLGAAALLAGCTAAEVQTAETDISAGIAATCHDVMAAQTANPKSPSAPWAVSACSPNGMAGLAQNSQTLVWLGTVLQQLQVPAAAPAS